MTIHFAVSTEASVRLGNTERVATAVAAMRSLVGSLDKALAALDPAPSDGSRCPEGLLAVKAQLRACGSEADNAGFVLLSRIVARAVGLTQRFCSGQMEWSLVGKLAIEELVTVVDMVVDVVELVGVDSGCRQEERISMRIVASAAPQVLAEVDGMDFREIRFHQAATGKRALRAS